LARGLMSFGFHTLQGVSNVVMKPIQGAKERGVEGFIIGTAAGLTGLITQPIAGLVSLGAKTAEGVMNTPQSISNAITSQSKFDMDEEIKKSTVHFGEPLDLSWARALYFEQVHVTLLTIDFLRKNGLKTQGIFRLQGSRKNIQEWKQLIDSGSEIRFTPQDHPHDVASLLLLYLRELPESLIPEAQWTPLLDEEDENFVFNMLVDIIQHVSQVSKLVLLKLINLLLLIEEESEHNLMDFHNLATCLAPNIFRFNFTPSEQGSMVEVEIEWSALEIIKKSNEIMEFMLVHWRAIEVKIHLQ